MTIDGPQTMYVSPEIGSPDQYYKTCVLNLLGWEVLIAHMNKWSTLGNDTAQAISDMAEKLGWLGIHTGSLGRGGVHHCMDERLNGLLEYTGCMAFVYVDWTTVVQWLNEGWPRPTADSKAPVGTWTFHAGDQLDRPEFSKAVKDQMSAKGIPEEVSDGLRLLTDEEAVGVMAKVIKTHRFRKYKPLYRWNQ